MVNSICIASITGPGTSRLIEPNSVLSRGLENWEGGLNERSDLIFGPGRVDQEGQARFAEIAGDRQPSFRSDRLGKHGLKVDLRAASRKNRETCRLDLSHDPIAAPAFSQFFWSNVGIEAVPGMG